MGVDSGARVNVYLPRDLKRRFVELHEDDPDATFAKILREGVIEACRRKESGR